MARGDGAYNESDEFQESYNENVGEDIRPLELADKMIGIHFLQILDSNYAFKIPLSCTALTAFISTSSS